jgi:hypothetical protein
VTTSAEEIRRRARKTVTTPSGIEVEIRRLRLSDFLGLGEIPLPSTEEKEVRSTDASQWQRILLYGNRTVTRGVISPRFTDDDENTDPTMAHVRDLTDQDLNFLIGEILAWSGLSKEVAADAEAFRPERVSQDGSGSGGEIPQISSRGDESNTG